MMPRIVQWISKRISRTRRPAPDPPKERSRTDFKCDQGCDVDCCPMNADDLVFCTAEGKPLAPNSVTKAFRDLGRSLRLSVRLHDMRHTHASLLLKQNIHPKIVSERLGHASIAITLDTYSHVVPGLQAAAARTFDEGFRQPQGDAGERGELLPNCA